MTALAFDRVACIRRGEPLFADLGFALGAGEALVVTGANGIGKSSLIRIAAGLLAPAAGKVVRAGKIALMTESLALDGDRSLINALAFWARIDGAGPDAVASALDTLDLARLAEIPVRMLSAGQRRRAAFARVLASNAAIWLLDEPANGLDAAAIRRLERCIDHHRAAGGIALVATHLPIAVPQARGIDLADHALAAVPA